MKTEKGITIIILTITVIVMLIILGIAISSGGESLETAELQAFAADCEVIQSKVDVINEKLKLNSNYLENIGIGADKIENEVKWGNNQIKENLNISNLTHDVEAKINFAKGTITINLVNKNDAIYGKYHWKNGKIENGIEEE